MKNCLIRRLLCCRLTSLIADNLGVVNVMDISFLLLIPLLL